MTQLFSERAVVRFDLLARYPDPIAFHGDRLGERCWVGDPNRVIQAILVRPEGKSLDYFGALTEWSADVIEEQPVDLGGYHDQRIVLKAAYRVAPR